MEVETVLIVGKCRREKRKFIHPSMISAILFLNRTENPSPKFFNYEGFFAKQLQKKKDEHSYRVFKKVLRDASSFPHAFEHSSGKEKDITVWCSNDYLGMSWHPKVKEAVRYAAV